MSATAQKGHFLPPLLREAYPRHTVKMVERQADVPHETARNWVRGKAVPSAETLLRWAARCEAMAAALRRTIDAERAAGAGGISAAHAGEDAALVGASPAAIKG